MNLFIVLLCDFSLRYILTSLFSSPTTHIFGEILSRQILIHSSALLRFPKSEVSNWLRASQTTWKFIWWIFITYISFALALSKLHVVAHTMCVVRDFQKYPKTSTLFSFSRADDNAKVIGWESVRHFVFSSKTEAATTDDTLPYLSAAHTVYLLIHVEEDVKMLTWGKIE